MWLKLIVTFPGQLYKAQGENKLWSGPQVLQCTASTTLSGRFVTSERSFVPAETRGEAQLPPGFTFQEPY